MNPLVTAYSDIVTGRTFAEFNLAYLPAYPYAWACVAFALCDLGAPLTKSKNWLMPKEEDFKPLGKIVKSISDSTFTTFYTWRNNDSN